METIIKAEVFSQKQQILISIFVVLFNIAFFRSTFSGINELFLSKNEAKKRRKNQTLKERIFYLKYRDILPKSFLLIYYIEVSLHLIFLAFCVFSSFFQSLAVFVTHSVRVVLIFNTIQYAILFLISWKPGDWNLHFEYWAPKPIEKNKNKKK